MKPRLSFFALFGSLGTLVCCVLPAVFVSLGLGAAFASLIGTFPQMIWLSEHKAIVFGIAGSLIVFSGIQQWRGRNAPCPTDPKLAAACKTTRKWSLFLLALSAVIFLVGFSFSYVLPRFQ